MKRLVFILLVLFSCKKDKEVCPEKAGNNLIAYTESIEYRVKTNASYVATYTKFGGFNSDGSPIFLSITDSLSGNDTIRFKSITSPSEIKYHYQIFTLSNVSDSNVVSIYINGISKGFRPNYGSVFNFMYTDY